MGLGMLLKIYNIAYTYFFPIRSYPYRNIQKKIRTRTNLRAKLQKLRGAIPQSVARLRRSVYGRVLVSVAGCYGFIYGVKRDVTWNTIKPWDGSDSLCWPVDSQVLKCNGFLFRLIFIHILATRLLFL